MTHICVSDLTSVGSDNGLSPGLRQAIIRTNAGIVLIRPLGTNFSEFLVEILKFSFKKMRLKVSSAKRRPFCLGPNVLNCRLQNDGQFVDQCLLTCIQSFHRRPGARHTRTCDVTMERYRNSHTKIEDSKMCILQCMGSKFCVKFQRCPLKFHTIFLTHVPQNVHFTSVENLTIYDIIEL